MDFLKNIFGGKNPLQSITAWGVALIAGGQSLEASGVLPPGFSATGQEVTNNIVAFMTSLGGLLSILGIRKAASAPNVVPKQ